MQEKTINIHIFLRSILKH